MLIPHAMVSIVGWHGSLNYALVIECSQCKLGSMVLCWAGMPPMAALPEPVL